MDGKKKILWITRTAVFVALLVAWQAATTPLGSSLVTGSVVNLLLVVSVMTCGLASGLTVAALSPVMAKLVGIGPLWSIIPFIMLGNMVLVLLWHVIGNRNFSRKTVVYIVALVCAGTAKFLVLYLGIVQLAVPFLLNLPAQQAAVVGAMFSFPQLITAAIGGTLAILLLPALKKAIRSSPA